MLVLPKWMQRKKQEGNHGHQIVVHILHPNVKQGLLATAATNVTRRRLQLWLLQLYLLYLELHHSSRGKHMSQHWLLSLLHSLPTYGAQNGLSQSS